MKTNAQMHQPTKAIHNHAARRSIPAYYRSADVDVHAKSADGDTPLHMAALWGDDASVERLLEAGAFVDEVGAGGRTALYYASLENHIAVAERLLAAGADPDIPSHLGMSARDIVAQREDRRLSELFAA